MARKKKTEEGNTSFKKSLLEEIVTHLKGGLRKVVKKEFILSPSVDVYDNDDDYNLVFNVPGMKKDDIDVRVIDNELFIEQKKEGMEKTDKRNTIVEEIEKGRFFRKFKLTEEIDIKNVEANLEDGVLIVSLPKIKNKKI